MRILFLTHYFHPEGNAPATRVYEMCRRFVKLGFEVGVVTGAPNVPSGVVYPGYRNRWRSREVVEGIETLRVWTYVAPNKGTVRRILNYLSFCATATLAGLGVRRPDLVIATSPQFFCAVAGGIFGALRRTPCTRFTGGTEALAAGRGFRSSRIGGGTPPRGRMSAMRRFRSVTGASSTSRNATLFTPARYAMSHARRTSPSGTASGPQSAA